jgi:hypothetical protein
VRQEGAEFRIALVIERGFRLQPFDALLDRVGIEPADLDQAGGFLDTLQWFSVQAEAASRLGDATFGCALAQHLSWRHYGLLGVLFEVSATPLVALRMLERLLPQFLPRVRFTMTEIGAVVRIRYEVEGDPALTWVHRQEVLCGMRLNPARAVGATFAPVAVRLRQLNIPPEDLRAFFGVEVAQGAPYDEIDLPLAGVAQPSLRADADLLRHLEDVESVMPPRLLPAHRRQAAADAAATAAATAAAEPLGCCCCCALICGISC